MNLLSELEGKSGENLCSATLRLLLLRSQDLRDRFIDHVSRNSRSGPITLGSHFSCTVEEPTVESGRSGRLDLMIETSDSVVGIENKLYAAFQEGQPFKYFETVSNRAKALAEIRGKHSQPLVAVLAPRSRHEEISAVIAENEGLLVLDWEEVLDNLQAVEASLDAETRVLLQSLGAYIYQNISLFPDWAEWVPHLCRKFDSGGTPLQRQVVGKVWSLFPDPGGRLSSGATWCGYYFTERSIGTRGWFGFLPRNELLQGALNEVEFIIAVSFDVPFEEAAFRKIKLRTGANFIGARQIYAWAINLDHSWAQPDSWKKHLQPLFTVYERIVVSAERNSANQSL